MLFERKILMAISLGLFKISDIMIVSMIILIIFNLSKRRKELQMKEALSNRKHGEYSSLHSINSNGSIHTVDTNAV